jgi:hypothetical protein
LKNLRRIAGAFESPGQWLSRFCQAVEKREIAMNCGLTEGNKEDKGNPMGATWHFHRLPPLGEERESFSFLLRFLCYLL